jgi:hypothetical protein
MMSDGNKRKVILLISKYAVLEMVEKWETRIKTVKQRQLQNPWNNYLNVFDVNNPKPKLPENDIFPGLVYRRNFHIYQSIFDN